MNSRAEKGHVTPRCGPGRRAQQILVLALLCQARWTKVSLVAGRWQVAACRGGVRLANDGQADYFFNVGQDAAICGVPEAAALSPHRRPPQVDKGIGPFQGYSRPVCGSRVGSWRRAHAA